MAPVSVNREELRDLGLRLDSELELPEHESALLRAVFVVAADATNPNGELGRSSLVQIDSQGRPTVAVEADFEAQLRILTAEGSDRAGRAFAGGSLSEEALPAAALDSPDVEKRITDRVVRKIAGMARKKKITLRGGRKITGAMSVELKITGTGDGCPSGEAGEPRRRSES